MRDELTRSVDLGELLERARDADPSVRIELRDPIAAHGEDAIDAMADWLGDPRLARFAVRVLERIGRDPSRCQAILETLAAVDRTELAPDVAGDIDAALATLGVSGPRPKVAGEAAITRAPGTPGVRGRGYWVMRTSPDERPYVWAEAQRGRLRQGWGWNAEMNLDNIANLVRRGGDLSDVQRASWRSRRMRTSEPDGMRVGDLVITPSLPNWGRLSVFRVVGSYEYSMDPPRRYNERFGHVLPVESVVIDIDRRAPRVSDGLRAMLRPQGRLYNISGYGGDVERLIGNQIALTRSGDRWGELWTEREYEVLFRRFPARGDRPTDDQVAILAAELGRTPDAISWQWGDGSAQCGGRSASTASEPLKAWLDRSGACEW